MTARNNAEPWPDNKINDKSHVVDVLYSERGNFYQVIQDLYVRMRYHRMMELKLSRMWQNRKAQIEEMYAGYDAVFINQAKNDDTVMRDKLAGQKWHTEEAASLAAQLTAELAILSAWNDGDLPSGPQALLADQTIQP